MTTRLEETLRRDFDRVTGLIAKMTDFAVQMLRDCVAAFGNGDRELASLIILRDQQIDQMDKQIDRLCLDFLVRHQPAGAHLRFAYAALQINFELERIGDYAESIARQTIKLIDLGCQVPTALFADITSASVSMLRNAVEAFVRRDAELAEMTGRIEEQVDTLRNQINSELMHLVQSNKIPLAALTPLMTIARRFERVSDQAKSICQETIYLCTGEFAKHAGPHLYRVLFVDDHHGCLSLMAEANGRGLGRSDLEFTSAGVEPQPLPAETIAALHAKGVFERAQKRLRDLSDFDRYQLVIALSPAAKNALPAPSRKTVQLDWFMADPGGISGSAEQIHEACEAAYRSLSRRISDLVGKLTGEQGKS